MRGLEPGRRAALENAWRRAREWCLAAGEAAWRLAGEYRAATAHWRWEDQLGLAAVLIGLVLLVPALVLQSLFGALVGAVVIAPGILLFWGGVALFIYARIRGGGGGRGGGGFGGGRFR